MTEITVWAERNMDRPGYTLYHREAPRIDEEPDEDGVVWPLAHNVRSFRLRYLDQVSGEWKDEWDTRSADTPYRLPRAVEIGLVLIAPDPEDPTGQRTVDVPFLATVNVEYAPRMPNPNDPASTAALQNPTGQYPNPQAQNPFGGPPTPARGGTPRSRNPRRNPRTDPGTGVVGGQPGVPGRGPGGRRLPLGGP